MEEPIGFWAFSRLSLTLASKEMVYFSKWIYRHRNRLRNDKSFQRLLQIERLIKRYLKINVISLAKQALKDAPNSSGRVIPSAQLISFMTQLSDCTLYVIQLLKLMESTFNDLYQRIETCHLLYAYIIISSSLSRLWFYLKRHVWVLCGVQSRLLADIQKPFDFDLSRLVTKDNMEYLPLSMKSLISQKENEEKMQDVGLMISSELQALRKRDFSSISNSNVYEEFQKSAKCSSEENESQIESKTKKKARKKMAAKLKRRNKRKIKRRELKREQKAIEKIRKRVSRRAAVSRFLLRKKKRKIKS